jgi:2-polyprenyl-6-methoxyphenol hydroxylase-like FAD-dependent oxidoreductase
MKAIIIGGGIGGLTTALFLHRIGIVCEIYEQAEEMRELGVGITLMPHGVAQLQALGLLPALDEIAIRSAHLYLVTRRGQGVWNEPRGLAAGHAVPQYFVHRGHLLGMLHRAVLRQLPEGTLKLGARLASFEQTDAGVAATLVDRGGAVVAEPRGDILIGADGIHSAVRRAIAPDEDGPIWSGLMLWRGATPWPKFLGGASKMIAGGVEAKFVAYPIAPGPSEATPLTNWAAIARVAEFGATPPRREDWSRLGRREEIAPLLEKFDLPELDVKALVAATEVFWEYPMCDRDPIAHWSKGRASLLGDAAHPMYPMGANGASQAILDARALSDALASHADAREALRAYERERLPGTSDIVRMNRIGGPESVIDAVESRAPDGFSDIDAVLSHVERERIVRSYASKTAFADRFAKAAT